MQRGEVWSVTLPVSNYGREQAGHRPCVVLQDAIYGRSSPLVLMAPLTSQLAALRFPAAVRIEPSPDNGLRLPSVAMVFQLRALDRTRFFRLLGRLDSADLEAVLAALRSLTRWANPRSLPVSWEGSRSGRASLACLTRSSLTRAANW